MKKPGREAGFFLARDARQLHRLDLVRLQPLLSLHDDEGHLLAFLQALEALALDRAEMHEHVIAILAADEAEALGIVEPFHGPGFAVRHTVVLPRRLVARRGPAKLSGRNVRPRS